MTQKQFEGKMETSDKEISSLKEMVFNLCKSVDQLREKVRENTSSKKVHVATLTEGSQMKLKGKMEDDEDSNPNTDGNAADKTKYKKLEIPIFARENSESWVYRMN